MTAQILRLDDYRKPAPTRGFDPYARVFLQNIDLWHKQCRLAAEFACAVFGYDDTRPSDTEPSA